MFTSGFEEANPGLTEQLVMDISDKVYGTVPSLVNVRVLPTEVYNRGFCSQYSWLMVEKLREQEIWSEIMTGRDYDMGKFHKFVDLGTDWVIDGTWQQKLLVPAPELPKVLICQKSYLGVILQLLNVPEKDHYFWLTAKPELDDPALRTNLLTAQ